MFHPRIGTHEHLLSVLNSDPERWQCDPRLQVYSNTSLERYGGEIQSLKLVVEVILAYL